MSSLSDLPSELRRYILGKVDPVEHLRALLALVPDFESLKPYILAIVARCHDFERARFDHVEVGDVICVMRPQTGPLAAAHPSWQAHYTVAFKGHAHINLRYEGNGHTRFGGERRKEWYAYERLRDFTRLGHGMYGRIMPPRSDEPEFDVFPV